MRITGVRVDIVDMGRANAHLRPHRHRHAASPAPARRSSSAAIAERRGEPARDRRVPRRQGRARDRGPLREAVPRHVLAGRPAARRRPERRRHRAVGPQGPVLQRPDLPDARRADARPRSSPTPTSQPDRRPRSSSRTCARSSSADTARPRPACRCSTASKRPEQVTADRVLRDARVARAVPQGDRVPADARLRPTWRAGSPRRARRSAGSSS